MDLLKSLGADEFIDYKKQDFEKVLRDYDFVLDSLGGENQEKSFTVIKNGGKLASIVFEPDQEKAAQKNIKSGNVWLNPNGPQLAKMAELL